MICIDRIHLEKQIKLDYVNYDLYW